MISSWTETVAQILRTQLPGIRINYLAQDVSSILSQNPSTVSGIILTHPAIGNVISEQVLHAIGCPHILPSALFSVCQQGSTENPRGTFAAFQKQAEGSSLNPLGTLQAIRLMLEALGLAREADLLNSAIVKTLEPIELIGSNTRTIDIGGPQQRNASPFIERVLDHLDRYLEAVNIVEAASHWSPSLIELPSSRLYTPRKSRPMGVIEKIMAHAGLGLELAEVKTNDMICVKVDWILTSELLWAEMEKTYNQMKRPRVISKRSLTAGYRSYRRSAYKSSTSSTEAY